MLTTICMAFLLISIAAMIYAALAYNKWSKFYNLLSEMYNGSQWGDLFNICLQEDYQPVLKECAKIINRNEEKEGKAHD